MARWQIAVLACVGLAALGFVQETGAQEPVVKSYSNYTVLRTAPLSPQQAAALLDMEGQQGLDWWTVPKADKSADVAAAPEARPQLEQRLRGLGVSHEVIFQNLQDHVSAIDTEQYRGKLLSARRDSDNYIDNKRYLDYGEVEDYISLLKKNHPNRVRVYDIGQTFEGRTMRVVHLSNCFYCNYSAVFVDAGIHAREWIAPAVALNALSQLAENETANAEMRAELDWYFLPVANPDGYEYTHTTDRLWRKTRSTIQNSRCLGADPNRNFDYYWNSVGASKNPCSETFAGRSAFSEKEVQNMRGFLWDHRFRLKLYITYHSYGNYILYPWGYKADDPDDVDTLRSVAMKANQAMVEAGSKPYTIGSSTQTLYAAAGGSDDWVKGILNVPLSYTIELPGYKYGFQLPTGLIEEVAHQSFEGLRAFAREVKALSRRPTARYGPRARARGV